MVETGGVKYLGSALGEEDFRQCFVAGKVQEWKGEVLRLAELARTEPHACYAAMTHGLRGRWSYVLRTVQVASSVVQPLDDAIVESLLPALSVRARFTDAELSLLRLPARLAELGLPHLAAMAESEFQASLLVTAGQVAQIVGQDSGSLPPTCRDVRVEAVAAKATVAKR